MKVLITGADGLVATHYLNYTGKLHDFICPDEKELDITDAVLVENYVTRVKPDCLVNFAAYTDTKNAETQRNDEKGSVWKINVDGVKNLAEACNKNGTHLIHISTDLIFSGKDAASEMYHEDEIYGLFYDKISWYGITKLEGEIALVENSKDYAIIRIAYPFAGSAHTKKDMLHNIIHLSDSNNLNPMFADNTITPTYINDLAKALNRIIKGHLTGIFHAVSHEPVSHYEFAKYVLEKSGRDFSKLEKGSLKEFAQKSGIPRPLYINLDTTGTEKRLGVKFGTWKQNVDDALKLLT
ncbi:MAG: dTDP-4-dehydrorhamnose reductase [candidate division WWE3 bacterium GW2011_GWD2_42_11]|nr:MAG: dTDP-4-dehydrorhamnose reductase [candidate division WWE3 bacterium GW2011_GWD2_42_11]KKS76942.1 MAG: dTDP-4-dehydrorhamnose reductase [candidate division WWE3 bacterium GW2011_GWA2_42_9]